MIDYNAVVQDASTSSWWQQATGEAIYGKRKGDKMEEYFSEQMSLSSWLLKYPNSLIFQPDSTFTESYEDYAGFATGYGAVNAREDSSWQRKSWVVGVVHNNKSMAFDYQELSESRVMHDSVGSVPIVVALEADTLSIHAWDTRMDTFNLFFELDAQEGWLKDVQTSSVWDMTGRCVSGELKGKKLKPVQSYVEYWHSWKEFQPKTRRHGID